MPLPTMTHLMVGMSPEAAAEPEAVSPVAVEPEVPVPPQAAMLSAIAPAMPSARTFFSFFIWFSPLCEMLLSKRDNHPLRNKWIGKYSPGANQPLTAPTVRPEMKYFWKNG